MQNKVDLNMATCGYLCPVCEGKGIKDDASDCDWCTPQISSAKKPSPTDLDNWIKTVHEGPCCGDLGTKEELND